MNLKTRTKEMQDFFNEKIDTYDDVHSEFMTTKKAITDSLTGNVEKVLDLGAGTGLELIYLYEKYPKVKVTAIDASEKMLEELMKRDFADKVTPMCGDFFELEFGKDYDAVISTSSLHHFNEPDKLKLYRKIYDSLKETGFFINCDKICFTQEEQNACFKEYEENGSSYKHFDTPLTVSNEEKILKESGFNKVTTANVDKENYSLIIAHKN